MFVLNTLYILIVLTLIELIKLLAIVGHANMMFTNGIEIPAGTCKLNTQRDLFFFLVDGNCKPLHRCTVAPAQTNVRNVSDVLRLLVICG